MSTRNDEEQPLLGNDSTSQHKTRHEVARQKTRELLESKYGHYFVLALVSLDVSGIFVDFVLQLLVCEGRLSPKEGDLASTILGIVSLVFSCLFMVELLASIWAFGKEYFYSWFHCFDASVIVLGFITDVLLKGVVEEIGSLVIVLRLWRVFKIIEELSAGAEEQFEPLQEELKGLREENDGLRKEVENLRRRR